MMFKKLCRIFFYWFKYLSDYLYDLTRYVKHSNIEYVEYQDIDKLISKIITLYHVIEKGLSLESPRLMFGLARVNLLMNCISMYAARVNVCDWSVHATSALHVLDEYLKFNECHGKKIPELENFLLNYSDILNCNSLAGGTKVLDIEEVALSDKPFFDDVIMARSSIRNFGEDSINIEDIYESIRTAQKSPSTCNRQSARVLITEDSKIISSLLALQNGANGFDSKIQCLLLVCCDLKYYQGVGDRMSGVIDGSLFGMTLLHALTRFKIASISLNWSKGYQNDKKLRKLIQIPESYNVLFFVGLGSFKEKTRVPVSTKSNVYDICKKIQPHTKSL